ncbi:uncharacterized protein [Macrobrachium rosenbergii]|uniref:uncharacterized protein n=1 Tax=Macrobrachium rosenbergii TaxID=79674 RepID=UPI0034D56213
MVIKRVGGEVLGKTSGKKPPDDKEAWRWNDEVKEVLKAKKDLGKVGQQEDKERYQRYKIQVKKAVAQEKARALEAPEGERKIHNIAKSRDKNTKNYSHIKQVKGRNGVVLCNEDKIKGEWRRSLPKIRKKG